MNNIDIKITYSQNDKNGNIRIMHKSKIDNEISGFIYLLPKDSDFINFMQKIFAGFCEEYGNDSFIQIEDLTHQPKPEPFFEYLEKKYSNSLFYYYSGGHRSKLSEDLKFNINKHFFNGKASSKFVLGSGKNIKQIIEEAIKKFPLFMELINLNDLNPKTSIYFCDLNHPLMKQWIPANCGMVSFTVFPSSAEMTGYFGNWEESRSNYDKIQTIISIN